MSRWRRATARSARSDAAVRWFFAVGPAAERAQPANGRFYNKAAGPKAAPAAP